MYVMVQIDGTVSLGVNCGSRVRCGRQKSEEGEEEEEEKRVEFGIVSSRRVREILLPMGTKRSILSREKNIHLMIPNNCRPEPDGGWASV